MVPVPIARCLRWCAAGLALAIAATPAVARANAPPDPIDPAEFWGALAGGPGLVFSFPVATDPDPDDNFGGTLTYHLDSCVAPYPNCSTAGVIPYFSPAGAWFYFTTLAGYDDGMPIYHLGPGAYVITYHVEDDDGAASPPATLTVHVASVPAIASDDYVTLVLKANGANLSGSYDGLLPIANVSKETGAVSIDIDTSDTSPYATVTAVDRPGVTDEMTPTYRYSYSGPASDPYPVRDSFRYSVTNLGGTSEIKEVSVVVFAPDPGTYAANDLSENALVVWNVNDPDAQQIADYYRSARGIDATRSCPVEMPTGLYASRDQMLSMRRQVLEGCICPIVANAVPPEASVTWTISRAGPVGGAR